VNGEAVRELFRDNNVDGRPMHSPSGQIFHRRVKLCLVHSLASWNPARSKKFDFSVLPTVAVRISLILRAIEL
jgi:hypothetical protein